jgi:hypothetical protein
MATKLVELKNHAVTIRLTADTRFDSEGVVFEVFPWQDVECEGGVRYYSNLYRTDVEYVLNIGEAWIFVEGKLFCDDMKSIVLWNNRAQGGMTKSELRHLGDMVARARDLAEEYVNQLRAEGLFD